MERAKGVPGAPGHANELDDDDDYEDESVASGEASRVPQSSTTYPGHDTHMPRPDRPRRDPASRQRACMRADMARAHEI